MRRKIEISLQGGLTMRFDAEDIALLADYFVESFSGYFPISSGNTIHSFLKIEVSNKLKSKVGLALLFEDKVRLNAEYFLHKPHYLPYTIFHEMTHVWLYRNGHDPGHTVRFYKKMKEFSDTEFLVDPEVHIHSRLAAEGCFVLSCTNCRNRWHLRQPPDEVIYCGHCWKHERKQYFAVCNTSSTEALEPITVDNQCA